MPDRIRICQVINRFVVGGAETVALDLARRLDPRRFTVEMVALLDRPEDPGAEMRRRCAEAGVPARGLGLGSFRNPLDLARLFWFLRRSRFQIVHGHSRFSDLWAARLGRLAGVPHRLWTRHLVYEDMSPRQLARYRFEARRADLVLAVSEEVRRSCIETEGIAPERVVTVVNGIDTDRFRPLPAERRRQVRAALALEAGDEMLLFVGRLAPQKAPEAFVDLVHALRAAGRPVRGFMCGQGPLAAAVHQRASTGAAVAVLGLRADVPELLGAADLVVSTSRNEGLPLNVMEAMAAGACFVGPRIPQIAGLVAGTPLATALFAPPPASGAVAPDQIAAWAELAASRLDDADLRGELGRQGRRLIEERFSLERMVGRHEEIYSALIAGH